MTPASQPLKLLIADPSAEAAEQVASVLRNAGITVRGRHARTTAELGPIIGEQVPDIVIAAADSPDLPLHEVIEAIAGDGRDIAVIGCCDHITDEIVTTAIGCGAQGIVLRGQADQLLAIVNREFAALNARRELRRLEFALHEAERRCDALLESSHDPIAYVHQGMHVKANRAYLEFFGYEDFDEIQGMSLLDMIAPGDATDFKALLQRLARGEKPPQHLNVSAQRADGTTFESSIEFAAASFEGEPCQQITFRTQVIDEQLAAKLDELRITDLVTGLLNRAAMLEHIAGAAKGVAGGESGRVLLLVEPDKFKEIIDSIGLSGADLLLGDIARNLRRALADNDACGRLAETVFAVLTAPRPAEEARALAERIRAGFEDHIFEAGSKSISLTASIGGTWVVERNARTEMLLDQSQEALRSARGDGGNRVVLHDPVAKDRAAAEKTQRAQSQIQQALENNGFVLYYQPIVNLHGDDSEYYEVLVRMLGPGGEVSPAQFMAVAEQHGMLPAIDHWVITNAVRALVERNRAGHRTTFFIKLSTPSLEDATLLPAIAQHLQASRLAGESLVFEMPESKVVTHLRPARIFVKGLEKLHCRFALEQFGAGVDSFQLLRHIPAQFLKIDRSFMVDLPRNKENEVKIRNICAEARQLGKLTVAEFVQDAVSIATLFNCGVNFVQGNFLQEPAKVMSHSAVEAAR